MSKKKLTVDPAALEVTFVHSDIGKTTIRGFLRRLLAQVWEDEEGFSGKRPWGNSGWQGDVEAALIRSGFATGSLDEDGYLDDDGNANEYLRALIDVMCAPSA